MRVRHMTMSVAEMSCAMTVAAAAPATPQSSATMNSTSQPTLNTPANSKKYSGLRVSPTARRMAAPAARAGTADDGRRRAERRSAGPGDAEARALFRRRDSLSGKEKEKLFGNLLLRLTREYGRRGILMQIHFAVDRNVHEEMFRRCGADSGFDVIGEAQDVRDVAAYFDRIPDAERPETVLYTLNDGNLPALACLTGAFRHVRMGAAWWFNDTVEGIRRNLATIAEYSALGTNFGMLTDSRSFSSYARFDFFRRLLSGYLGGLAERGEYDISAAETVAKDICYDNIKGVLGL